MARLETGSDAAWLEDSCETWWNSHANVSFVLFNFVQRAYVRVNIQARRPIQVVGPLLLHEFGSLNRLWDGVWLCRPPLHERSANDREEPGHAQVGEPITDAHVEGGRTSRCDQRHHRRLACAERISLGHHTPMRINDH